MSVHTVELRSGSTFEVRYRAGGRQYAKRFDTPEEAAEFDQGIQAWLAWQRAEARWNALPEHVRQRVTGD